MRTYLVEAFLLIAGLLLSVFYTQGLVTLQMLLVTSGIIIVALILSLVPRWWPTDQSLWSWLCDVGTRARLLWRYPNFEELQQVLRSMVYADDKPIFFMPPDEANRIENYLMAGRQGLWIFRPKPRVFFQVRVRDHLSWGDALYWLTARDLKELGFDVWIFIHDYDYIIEEGRVYFRKEKKGYIARVKKTAACVRDLCGSGIHIIYASTYFVEKDRSRRLMDYIYKEIVYLFVRKLEGIQVPEPGSREIDYTVTDMLNTMIGWVGAFAALCLIVEAECPLLTVLQWEKRADKWYWIRETEGIPALSFILCRTFWDSQGNHVRTAEWDGSFNLTDSLSQLADKMFGQQVVSHVVDPYILRAVCGSLLYSDERDFLWEAFVDGATPEEIKNLVTLYRTKHIIDSQTFGAVNQILKEDNSWQGKVEQLKQDARLTEAYLTVRMLEGFKMLAIRFPHIRARRLLERREKDVLDIVGDRYQ